MVGVPGLKPGFAVEACDDGSFTLRDIACDQAMHSSMGAWNEAHALYVGPTEISGPLAVLDVGLGIAANSLALVERWRTEGATHPLRILSIENRTAGLRAALADTARFPWVARNRAVMESLLESGEAREAGLLWELWHGDVREFSRPEFGAQVIYFDMYAPKVDPSLWSEAVFREMGRAGAPSHRLLTYSYTRTVRDALAAAGYAVSKGPSTPLKRDTTIATAPAR